MLVLCSEFHCDCEIKSNHNLILSLCVVDDDDDVNFKNENSQKFIIKLCDCDFFKTQTDVMKSGCPIWKSAGDPDDDNDAALKNAITRLLLKSATNNVPVNLLM